MMATFNARAQQISANRLQLRSQLWPDVPEGMLWQRKLRKGFITVPRPLPLILSIMDDLSKNKPLSATYLALFCRSFDESMVIITSPAQVAFESGFTGERGTGTWMGRMKKLVDLGFIKAQPGATGPYSNVLLLNPFLVIRRLKAEGIEKISDQKYNALLGRALEIGADDMESPVQVLLPSPGS